MTDEPELRSMADLIKACFAAHREATEFCVALGDTDAATVDFLALKILKRRWRAETWLRRPLSHANDTAALIIQK